LKGCGGFNNQQVSVKVKNTSQNAIPANSVIDISYKFGDDAVVAEQIKFSSELPAGTQFVYDFTHTLTQSEVGSKNIEFTTLYKGDMMDKVDYDIDVFEKPLIFDGKTSIGEVVYPYLLDSKVVAESYLWNTGETTQKITVNTDGTYTVTIVDANACEYTASVVVTKGVGVGDMWSSQISVYPNPSKDKINIVLPSEERDVAVEITNMDGKIVYVNANASGNIQLDITHWSRGVYVLKVSNSQNFGVYQIIKQ
jgi:hypothetical protein